jgi:hypothetical protein
MSNNAARILALSIAILASAILIGLGSVAQAMNTNRGQEAQLFGFLLGLVGGVFFVIELLFSIRTRD